MNRTIDVRTEMRKLADSKPVHAAAGVGLLASETLRELTAWLTKMRNEASAGTLSSRASGYVPVSIRWSSVSQSIKPSNRELSTPRTSACATVSTPDFFCDVPK